MVYNFLITLKKPDFKIADTMSQLLYLIAFSVFIFFSTKMPALLNVYSIAALLLLAIFIGLRVKKAKKGFVYFTPGLAIAAITFMAGPNSNWVLCLFFVACVFFEREFKFTREVGFTEKEVVFNTLIKRHHDWPEFQNVMIKDGIITLDFKNNKIVQKEIEGDVSPEIEVEFNNFCRERINASAQKTQLTQA